MIVNHAWTRITYLVIALSDDCMYYILKNGVKERLEFLRRGYLQGSI